MQKGQTEKNENKGNKSFDSVLYSTSYTTYVENMFDRPNKVLNTVDGLVPIKC